MAKNNFNPLFKAKSANETALDKPAQKSNKRYRPKKQKAVQPAPKQENAVKQPVQKQTAQKQNNQKITNALYGSSSDTARFCVYDLIYLV